MMKRTVLVVSLVGVMGCATTLWYGTPSNVQSTTLRIGMTQREAAAMLGSPKDIIGQDSDGVMIETWKYLDRTLTFQNRLLQSWVDNAQASSKTARHAGTP